MRVLILLLFTSILATQGTPQSQRKYETRHLAGWTVKVNSDLLGEKQKESTQKALTLLRLQLEEIVRVVPKAAVRDLVKVTLWLSPAYEGFPPRAEYHPSSQWLQQNGRDPAMAKSVEFTNIAIFEQETRRMPNFALHELAHAYHDRVLGTEQSEIKAAYEKAKASGKYDNVEQRFGDGRSGKGKAYAMTNHQEYFAECTEAYFSTNDFFPFVKKELLEHDSEMHDLLRRLWFR